MRKLLCALGRHPWLYGHWQTGYHDVWATTRDCPHCGRIEVRDGTFKWLRTLEENLKSVDGVVRKGRPGHD